VREAREPLAWAGERLAGLGRSDRLVSISVPAPVAAPETLLRRAPRALGLLWHPQQGIGVAGVGAALRIDLKGRQRFDDLRRGAAALFRQLEEIAHPNCQPPPPRLFGGLAFAPGAAAESPWQAFGDGSFCLPRWRYTVEDEQAALTLTVRGGEVGGGARVWLEGMGRILEALARAQTRSQPPPPLPAVERVARPSRTRFMAQVEAIRGAIASGGFEKIVAAHRTVVTLTAAADVLGVLERLGRGLRASTRFAFVREDATLFGATPERLVRLEGRALETEALAGSLAVDEGPARQLLASRKDRCEHQLVVRSIVRRLEPLVERLEVAAAPRVRSLREVLHLHTPIRGVLAAPRHVLDLVELLHPTPAVGGVPTGDAMRWIADNEPQGRGWYAGPIGWFDARGDGAFAVALRTCVLRGRRAYLYAGAGIVADSDPLLEYAETAVKWRGLLRALGVER